jgi:hypothetical protein
MKFSVTGQEKGELLIQEKKKKKPKDDIINEQ